MDDDTAHLFTEENDRPFQEPKCATQLRLDRNCLENEEQNTDECSDDGGTDDAENDESNHETDDAGDDDGVDDGEGDGDDDAAGDGDGDGDDDGDDDGDVGDRTGDDLPILGKLPKITDSPGREKEEKKSRFRRRSCGFLCVAAAVFVVNVLLPSERSAVDKEGLPRRNWPLYTLPVGVSSIAASIFADEAALRRHSWKVSLPLDVAVSEEELERLPYLGTMYCEIDLPLLYHLWFRIPFLWPSQKAWRPYILQLAKSPAVSQTDEPTTDVEQRSSSPSIPRMSAVTLLHRTAPARLLFDNTPIDVILIRPQAESKFLSFRWSLPTWLKERYFDGEATKFLRSAQLDWLRFRAKQKRLWEGGDQRWEQQISGNGRRGWGGVESQTGASSPWTKNGGGDLVFCDADCSAPSAEANPLRALEHQTSPAHCIPVELAVPAMPYYFSIDGNDVLPNGLTKEEIWTIVDGTDGQIIFGVEPYCDPIELCEAPLFALERFKKLGWGKKVFFPNGGMFSGALLPLLFFSMWRAHMLSSLPSDNDQLAMGEFFLQHFHSPGWQLQSLFEELLEKRGSPELREVYASLDNELKFLIFKRIRRSKIVHADRDRNLFVNLTDYTCLNLPEMKFSISMMLTNWRYKCDCCKYRWIHWPMHAYHILFPGVVRGTYPADCSECFDFRLHKESGLCVIETTTRGLIGSSKTASTTAVEGRGDGSERRGLGDISATGSGYSGAEGEKSSTKSRNDLRINIADVNTEEEELENSTDDGDNPGQCSGIAKPKTRPVFFHSPGPYAHFTMTALMDDVYFKCLRRGNAAYDRFSPPLPQLP